MDMSKVVEGAAVKHKGSGIGTIARVDKSKKYITVTFTVGEKKFSLPDAFTRGFLTFR